MENKYYFLPLETNFLLKDVEGRTYYLHPYGGWELCPYQYKGFKKIDATLNNITLETKKFYKNYNSLSGLHILKKALFYSDLLDSTSL